MGKFIRENWFKIIIAIVILMIGASIGYYFVFYLPKYQEEKLLVQNSEQINSNSFSDQTKCASAANNFFTKNGYSVNSSVTDGYISHWNKSLNKCFIEFSSGLSSGDKTDIIYELADAVEGTEYAEIQWAIPDENKPGWCTLYPSGNSAGSNTKSCNSKTEFDNFVAPFMTN